MPTHFPHIQTDGMIIITTITGTDHTIIISDGVQAGDTITGILDTVGTTLIIMVGIIHIIIITGIHHIIMVMDMVTVMDVDIPITDMIAVITIPNQEKYIMAQD